ncbi:MAG: DNA polymerase III subunit delta [Pseudomonadota bacterium]
MRLKPEQLVSHIQRGDLAPVYFISGDEPLQRLESIDRLRNAARNQGFDERNVFNIDKSFDWQSINQANANLSLFASRRILELRMQSPKPGKEGAAAILDVLEANNPDNLLIISADKMDKSVQNTKWVKAIDKYGVIIQVWPIGSAQLPDWIQARFREQNKKINGDAARFIAQRVEGNLLAARQEIDKQVLLYEKESIELEDIMSAITDSARYDVFNMIESAYLGAAERTKLMLTGLRKEGAEPMALFGAFMWEFRRTCSFAHEKNNGANIEQLYRNYRIWDSKKRAIDRVLTRHKLKQLDKLLAYCATVDRNLKSSDKQLAWSKLELLLLTLAGIETNLI